MEEVFKQQVLLDCQALYDYPEIPIEEQNDPNTNLVDPKWTMRLIPTVETDVWGRPEVARFRASLVTKVTMENEGLVRTFHPALCEQPVVFVCESVFGPPIWVVYGDVKEVKAGGRDIHFHPLDHEDLFAYGTIPSPRSPSLEESLFPNAINPREFLNPEQLDALRDLFPNSIGARVLVTGFLVVLLPSKADIEEVHQFNWVKEIGGLRVIYDVFDPQASAGTLASGFEVSTSPESPLCAGCLGLRLRFADGREAITTVTHGFVKLPGLMSVSQRLYDFFSMAKKAIQRFTTLYSIAEAPAVGFTRDPPLENSPVGKEVWLCFGNCHVGTISHTFDAPSASHPYPEGYKHDLSLITGPDLPTIVSPPGYPVIRGWAPYIKPLSGQNIFAVRMHARFSRWRAITGIVDHDVFRDATILGSQWIWDRTSRKQEAALLWRTFGDSQPVEGWSGSVLCSGRPEDEETQAILFQNYQTPWHTEIDPRTRKRKFALIKVGFLLPREVRSAAIVMPYDENNTRKYHSLPTKTRSNRDPDARHFSGLN